MESSVYQQDEIYSVTGIGLSEASMEVIHHTIRRSHPVGFAAGRYDAALTITHVSDFFLRNLGYSGYPEFLQATGGSLKKLVYGENRSFLEEGRWQRIQGAGDGQLLTRDGMPVYARLLKQDSVDAAGVPIWIMSAQIDWTRQNLYLVNKTIQSGLWYIDCDENGAESSVVYSHEFREMLGYHDILDFPNRLRSWAELIHPEDAPRVLRELGEVIADRSGQKKFDVEYRMKLRGGSYQWFRDKADTSRRLNGTVRRLVGVFINIDQEKKAEEQARKSEAFHRAFTEANICEYYVDLKKDRFESMKEHATALTPYEGCQRWDALVKAYLEQFILEEDRAAVAALFDRRKIAKKLAEGKTSELMLECRVRQNGEERWVRNVVMPGETGAAPRYAIVFIRDITEAKRQELQSRIALKDAYDAANRANRAKTEFLSNMSHDIRTPMNAIVGMTAIAGANVNDPERVKDCLGKITQASRHLLSLINEVLDMSRIESGKVSLMEEDFNLAELVDNLVVLAKPDAAAHNHQFSVHLEQIEHEEVTGDSLRIQQVMTNILSNAVKYTPDGGKIVFSIAERPSRVHGMGCYEFTVEDNGVGMTLEFQKVLFEPFTRADDKRTTKIQGTGLGMAIARNIVNMMDGHIRVESAPGKGSRFTVTIFLRLRAQADQKLEELANLPVLVVDDDEASCEGTVGILNEIGMEAEWVNSGEKAVARTVDRHAQGEDYFAILMDWQMPGMNGIEATRAIRQKVGREVPIIVLTAYDYVGIEQEAREAGVNEFITKPLFRSRLTAALKNLVEGRPHLPVQDDSLAEMSHCPGKGKRILLVEDNALNIEIAKEILEMSGAAVEVAENGRSAVEKFTEAPVGYYDLIFMDIQMPVMNGYEAAAAIRSMKDHGGQDVPIVAMTANAFAEDVLLSRNAGMNEHIAKPLDINKLENVLREWL